MKKNSHINGVAFLLGAHASLIFVFLFLPIIVLAILSFNNSFTITFPWRGFTLNWYKEALGNTEFVRSFLNSSAVGICTAAISTVVGTMAALAVRRGFRFQGSVLNLMLLPMVTPPLVAGFALFMMLATLGIPKNLFGSVLVGHTVFTIPYVFMIVSARLSTVNKALDEAASDLGANGSQTFFYVIFPLIWPAMLGSALLTFLLSFDEFIRTFFLVGTEPTLPLTVWGLLFDVVTPEIPALMTMLLAFTVAVLLSSQAAMRAGSPTSGSNSR